MSMRATIRNTIVGLFIILTFPLWLPAVIEKWVCSAEMFFKFGSDSVSLVPGILGLYMRRSYYAMTLNQFSWDCHVGFLTTFAHRNAHVGKGVYIGSRGNLGCVDLQDHVTIGCNSDILSGRHQHNFQSINMPIQQQGGSFAQIHIGRNCWIGNSVVIMADIGSECIIGAGSVVVKPIPPSAIAVGNPCKMIKDRNQAESDTSINIPALNR